MRTKKLIKKIGYGYSISYNEYRNLFYVYKIGDWSLGKEVNKNSKITFNSDLKKALKKYIKKYKKIPRK